MRDALREEICLAIRLGFLDEALAMLNSADWGDEDAAWFNLAGVIHERLRQWRIAWRYYRESIESDHHYAPPRQNLRRLYELYTFGTSRVPVSMGDERPALSRLLEAAGRA